MEQDIKGSKEKHDEAQPIIEHTPLNSEHTPLNSENTPLNSEHTPLNTEHTPFSSEQTPLSSEHTPLSTEGKNEKDEKEKTPKVKDHQLDLSNEKFEEFQGKEIETKDEKELFWETESTIPFRGQNNPFKTQEPSSCNPGKGEYDHTQDQILKGECDQEQDQILIGDCDQQQNQALERNFESLNLTLENFDVPSEVPPDCPYVLTSPRSLEACKILGIQPVELLPVSLQEYETTFSRLDRHEVLSVWREVESEREAQLEIARRLRKQLAGEINAPRPCLSPIVEGRDSAVGTSSTLLLLNPDIRVTDSSPISSQDDSAIADCGKRLHSTHQPPAYRSVSVPLLVVTRSDNSILEREEEDLDEHGSMHLDVPFPWDTFSDTSQESELMLLQDTPSPMCHDYGGRTGLKCLIGEESEWDRVGRCYSEESETAQEFWEVSKGGKADPFDEHDEDLELEEAVSADGIHDHTELSSDQNMLTTDHSMLSSSQHALQHTLTRVHQSMRKHDCRKQLRVQIIDRNGSGSKKCVTTSAKKKAARKTRLTAESITNLYQRGPSLEKEDENETPINDEETINEEEYLIKHQGGQPNMGRSGGDYDLPSKKLILHKVFSRSEIDVSKMKISQQESRIIEILAFKRYQEEYEERRKENERRKWEKDRKGREMTKKETEREFRKQLLQKRRKENEECQRRLVLAREQFLESQEYLRQLLKDKDERKKNLIETINRQKRTLIRQWREREETRKSSVDTAVQQLLQRDTQYREQLNRMLEKRLESVLSRKVNLDRIRVDKIAESNRSEESEHKARMDRIEEMYTRHIQMVKQTIENKLRHANEAIEEYRERQMQNFRRRTAYMKQSQVNSLKAELEAGLDLWRKQVLSVQSLSIRKAEERARKELERRRERLADEMKTREKRCEERRKEKMEKEEERMKTVIQKLQVKDRKVERLLTAREESIAEARRMAETSARLRDILRKQNLSSLIDDELCWKFSRK